MATPCIVCDNNSGSREHFWPQWIHESKDFGPLKQKRGGKEITIPDPKLVVKAVCKRCNNGWMSDLEVASIPLVCSMMQNLSIRLERDQQNILAQWLMKMAFLTDWTRVGGREKRFYTREEGAAFAEDCTIPPRTRIWIGHIISSHLSFDGHDATRLAAADRSRLGLSTSITLAVGHLAGQIVTDHLVPEHDNQHAPDTQPNSGRWAARLIQIWPVEKDWMMWPPVASFTNGGPQGYDYLLDRWRVGERVEKLI
jgi:hypothetical protein